MTVNDVKMEALAEMIVEASDYAPRLAKLLDTIQYQNEESDEADEAYDLAKVIEGLLISARKILYVNGDEMKDMLKSL